MTLDEQDEQERTRLTASDLHDQLDTLLAAMYALLSLQRGRSREQRACLLMVYDQLREVYTELIQEVR